MVLMIFVTYRAAWEKKKTLLRGKKHQTVLPVLVQGLCDLFALQSITLFYFKQDGPILAE